MKPRSVITIVLLLFVGVSVAYLLVREMRPDGAAPQAAPIAETDGPPPAAPAGGEFAGIEHRVIAYYFHRRTRCKTCLAIEANAQAALREAYPDAFAAGNVEWRIVNFEEPEHEHFAKDYELYTSSLVLVDVHGGAQREWKLLEKVWDLVWDPAEFDAYVQDELRPYLEHDA